MNRRVKELDHEPITHISGTLVGRVWNGERWRFFRIRSNADTHRGFKYWCEWLLKHIGFAKDVEVYRVWSSSSHHEVRGYRKVVTPC